MKYAVAVLLLVPAMAFAGVDIALTNGGIGGDSSADVLVGSADDISLDIVMLATSPLGAWDASVATNAPGLTAEMVLGAPWTAGDWDNASLFGQSVAGTFAVSPATPSLGRLKPSVPDYAAGDYVVATLNIHGIAALPEGQYDFDLVAGTGTGARYWTNTTDGAAYPDFDSIGGFTLNITPEPASLMLLAVGALFLRRRR